MSRRSHHPAACAALVCGLGLALAVLPSPLAADDAGATVTRYQVEAAFVYNFAKFVEWPSGSELSAEPSIRIGVLGDEAFRAALERTVRGKTALGKRIVVQGFEDSGTLRPCHILYIGSEESSSLPELLQKISAWPTLTVSSTDSFERVGGMVRFLVRDSKVRFRINADAAERARLRISSRLLSLAEVVRDEPGERSWM